MINFKNILSLIFKMLTMKVDKKSILTQTIYSKFKNDSKETKSILVKNVIPIGVNTSNII